MFRLAGQLWAVERNNCLRQRSNWRFLNSKTRACEKFDLVALRTQGGPANGQTVKLREASNA